MVFSGSNMYIFFWIDHGFFESYCMKAYSFQCFEHLVLAD